MQTYEHLFMPIISSYDETIGKWGIFDKKGNVIVPFIFDNLLSSSDDFNYTHYEMDGIKIRMCLCPIPFSKFPSMPENMTSWIQNTSIPIFIKVYKQMVFTFTFDPEHTSTKLEKVRHAKQDFIDSFEKNELEFSLESIPSYILEDIPHTIDRVPRSYPTGFEIISDEIAMLDTLQEECRKFYEPLIIQHRETLKEYHSSMAENRIDKLFKEAVESSLDRYRATEQEYNEQVEMLEWLKNTCEFRMFGTN